MFKYVYLQLYTDNSRQIYKQVTSTFMHQTMCWEEKINSTS